MILGYLLGIKSANERGICMKKTYVAQPYCCPVCNSKSFLPEEETVLNALRYSFVVYKCVECNATWFVQQLVTYEGDTAS